MRCFVRPRMRRVYLRVTLLAGLASIGTACAKKRPLQELPFVICRLPAANIAEVRQVKRTFDVPRRLRFRLLNLLRDKCRGWPRYVPEMIRRLESDARYGRHHTCKLPAHSSTAFKRKVIERLCPGYGKLQIADGRYGSVVWHHCGLAKWNLLTTWELGWNGTAAFVAMATYRMLRKGGMEHGLARTFARLLLRDNWLRLELLRNHPRLAVQLPFSSSTSAGADAVDLKVTERQILVRDKVVVWIKGGRGGPGVEQTILRSNASKSLLKELSRQRKTLEAAERQGGMPFRGDLLLAAPSETSYRSLSEVLRIAARAGFRKIQIVTRHHRRRNGVVVVELGDPSKTHTGKPGCPALVVTSRLITVKSTQSAAPALFTVKRSDLRTALRKLARALQEQLPAGHQRQTPPSTLRRIVVSPSAEVTLGSLIQVFDATRETPDAGAAGCPMIRDERSFVWSHLGPSSACMYPVPVLVLR